MFNKVEIKKKLKKLIYTYMCKINTKKNLCCQVVAFNQSALQKADFKEGETVAALTTLSVILHMHNHVSCRLLNRLHAVITPW